MSTTTSNLHLIQPERAESGVMTTYKNNNTTIDNAYGQYINDYEQSLENVAPIEGTTASKNYTVGSYLVKDGGLYKVTAAIASGESIVVGTNVVATSLNDAVVELNTAVAAVQDSLAKTQISIEQWITSSTALTYTGVSFTIPANYIYGASIYAVFANSAPLEVVVSRKSDPSDTNLYIARCTSTSLGSGSCSCNITGLLGEQVTYYVHAKYGGVAANRIDVKGWYMPL